jgi:Holliday junction resolvase RusA-like endonuclease
MSVRIRVYAHPAPQGSKVRTKWGMREASAGLMPWREAIVSQIIRDGYDRTMLEVPVLVRMEVLFARPKSHFGSRKGQPYLKDSAPYWKASDPDLDKIQRSVGDALAQGGVLADDNLIVRWDTGKRYCFIGEREGATIEVIPIPAEG